MFVVTSGKLQSAVLAEWMKCYWKQRRNQSGQRGLKPLP